MELFGCILIMFLNLLKILCAVLFTGLLGYHVFRLARQILISSVSSFLSPILDIPGVSHFLAFCGLNYESLGNPKDFDSTTGVSESNNRSKREEAQRLEPLQFSSEYLSVLNSQTHYEKIIASSTRAAGLPLSINLAETSITDLRITVETSKTFPADLKSALISCFDDFNSLANQAGEDLQGFNALLIHTVNMVLTTTQWTEQRLVELRSYWERTLVTESASQSASHSQFAAVIKARVEAHFQKHIEVITEETDLLVTSAVRASSTLYDLGEAANNIFKTISQQQEKSKDRIDNLWFFQKWFSGGELRTLDRQLQTLSHAVMVRGVAKDHVNSVIVLLTGIQYGITYLRSDVSDAGELHAKGISLDVIIETVKKAGLALLDNVDIAQQATCKPDKTIERS